MNDVVKRFSGCDRTAPSPARAHFTGYFLKPKLFTLENDERFNFWIFQRKTPGEDFESFTIDADESGSRIVYRFPQDGPQHDPEQPFPFAE